MGILYLLGGALVAMFVFCMSLYFLNSDTGEWPPLAPSPGSVVEREEQPQAEPQRYQSQPDGYQVIPLWHVVSPAYESCPDG